MTWKYGRSLARSVGIALVAGLTTACLNPVKLAAPLLKEPRAVPLKVDDPVRTDARLAVLWVGHATMLIQLDDKLILTDPVFTSSVGQMSKRIVEPGLDVDNVPMVDATLISHLHFDHLSLGSLELLESRIGRLFMPRGGMVYLTDFAFPAEELPPWNTRAAGGVRITAAPVEHAGMRYGADFAWMRVSYTGYIIQHGGLTVYFGGDTAYDQKLFVETAKRFPSIDVALLPISPVEPREFMKKTHVSPDEAVRAFRDLKAKRMVPMHYDTFENSGDQHGDALRELRKAMKRRGVRDDEMHILEIGEQRVLIPKPPSRSD